MSEPVTTRDSGAEEQHPAGRSYGRNFWLAFAATFALNLTANLFALFPLFIVRLGGGTAGGDLYHHRRATGSAPAPRLSPALQLKSRRPR